jgi:hypothetical protein
MTTTTLTGDDQSPTEKTPDFEAVFCRLPPAEKAALKSMAEHRGMTMTAFVSHMLGIFMQARTISERERMRTESFFRRSDAA